MLFLCGMLLDTGEITTMTAFTYRYKPNEAKSFMQWLKVHRDGTYSINTIDKQSLILL